MRVAPYVPLSAIFPEERGDFASFCAMVRTLSRTDAIFWCARLNLILSNPQNTDEASAQSYCISQFCGPEEIERGKRFATEHPGATPFSRAQLLELIRWTCLLADDLPGDGHTFNDPPTTSWAGLAPAASRTPFHGTPHKKVLFYLAPDRV
jgi:hypothetical protein